MLVECLGGCPTPSSWHVSGGGPPFQLPRLAGQRQRNTLDALRVGVQDCPARCRQTALAQCWVTSRMRVPRASPLCIAGSADGKRVSAQPVAVLIEPESAARRTGVSVGARPTDRGRAADRSCGIAGHLRVTCISRTRLNCPSHVQGCAQLRLGIGRSSYGNAIAGEAGG